MYVAQLNFNTAAPRLPTPTSNWFASDFEKILSEVVLLNPPAGRSREDLLPGECFHDVAQNPRSASSIGATQVNDHQRPRIT